MSPCLTIKDLVELNQEEVRRTTEKAAALDPKAPAAGEIFAHQVKALHASLLSTYRLAAHLATRTEDVQTLAEIWSAVSLACDEILRTLKTLKDDYPLCGTPELYDLALDYKNAASKRHQLNREAMEWKNATMPAGLFPEPN
ncbi:MAG: hypothetical protein HY735_29265 [Verrucomicrobia bacterium]|nr:hypothetical protein [Verrucomicrobiota bacterium]